LARHLSRPHGTRQCVDEWSTALKCRAIFAASLRDAVLHFSRLKVAPTELSLSPVVCNDVGSHPGLFCSTPRGANRHRYTQVLTDQVRCRTITLLLSGIGARGVPAGTIEAGSTPQSSPRDSSMRRRMVHGTEVPCYFRCVPPGRRAPLLQAEGRAHGAEPVASCV